jgi:glycosyltransferase involved in cell wall biosynthesis
MPIRVKHAQDINKLDKHNVAAIITCHNYGRFLEECIQSVINQSCSFDEIVVVDDDSTDNTFDIVSKFEDRGVRYLSVHWHEVSSSRNSGAEATRSHILCFIDADNVLGPKFVEKLLPEFIDQDLAISYAPFAAIDAQGNLLPDGCPIHDIGYEDLSRWNGIDACCLVRREALDSINGWKHTKVSCFEDWFTWREISRRGWKWKYFNEKLWFYRKHSDQVTNRRNFNDCYIEEIRSLHLAVVSIFSGRNWALPMWARGIEKLDWPCERLHLVAIDNSCDPEFNVALRRTAEIACRDWSGQTFYSLPTQANSTTSNEDWATNAWRLPDGYRIGRIMAGLYMTAVGQIPPICDLVLSVEDDIEIVSADPLAHLTEGLLPDTMAVAGMVRFRNPYADERGERYVIANTVSQWTPWQGEPIRYDADRSDIQDIDSSHFACTLFRARAWRLDGRSPGPLLARRGNVNGAEDMLSTWHDVASCSNWRRAGWKHKLHWGVRCKHWASEKEWS